MSFWRHQRPAAEKSDLVRMIGLDGQSSYLIVSDVTTDDAGLTVTYDLIRDPGDEIDTP